MCAVIMAGQERGMATVDIVIQVVQYHTYSTDRLPDEWHGMTDDEQAAWVREHGVFIEVTDEEIDEPRVLAVSVVTEDDAD